MAASLVGTATAVLAAPPETTESLLIATLQANASGECPDALMAAALKAECEQNLPTFVDILKRLGSIQAAQFQGTETIPSGPAEIYKVTFANGDMTFIINTLDDGRAMTLIAPDPPHWNSPPRQRAPTAQP
jgi:hypothetical protein